MFSILHQYCPPVCPTCAIAMSNGAVFCSSLISCFSGMLLRFCLKDFKMAPVITDNAFVFTFHIRCISIIRSYRFRILSASFLITFLLHKNAIPIHMHVPFSLSRIMVPGLLIGMALSVCTCWFHNMVTWPSRLISTDYGTWSCHCSSSNITPVSLHTLQCS